MRKTVVPGVLLTVLSAVLVTLLAGCSGDDGGRPTIDQVAAALKDTGNAASAGFAADGASDAQLDCLAKALHDSDLSDHAVRAIVDGDAGFDGEQDDAEVMNSAAFQRAFSACLTG